MRRLTACQAYRIVIKYAEERYHPITGWFEINIWNGKDKIDIPDKKISDEIKEDLEKYFFDLLALESKDETGEYSELEQAFEAACMLVAGHDESMKVSIYKLEDESYDIGPVESTQTHLMSGPVIEIGDVNGWDPDYFDFGKNYSSATLDEKAKIAYNLNCSEWLYYFCERNDITK
jgi:hypothetical protein